MSESQEKRYVLTFRASSSSSDRSSVESAADGMVKSVLAMHPATNGENRCSRSDAVKEDSGWGVDFDCYSYQDGDNKALASGRRIEAHLLQNAPAGISVELAGVVEQPFARIGNRPVWPNGGPFSVFGN